MKKNVNRFIEIERCDAPKLPLAQRKVEFKEIYTQLETTDLKQQAERCLECGNPYCQWKCPLHNYIPQWLKLAYEGRVIEAAELSHQTNSFPEICGRVCPQDRLCEGSCTLNDGFGAVSIGNVERYVNDEAFKQGWQPNYTSQYQLEQKVAVLGAGPAGLACADMLTRMGFKVTVFERQAMIGGLLTYGIPAFKLEKSILQHRFELFQQAGVEFRLNTEIGRDISLAQIETEFDAIFIGTGTYLPVREASLQISTNGVIESLEYLTAVNQDLLANQDIQYKSLVETKQVVVLGGGDTAMDCIRTSLRLGANAVTGVYRRTQSDMPGSAKEYLNACEEGAKFIFNAQPVAILAQDGQVTGVRFIQTKIEVDANKRKQLVNIVGSEFDVEADLVITAFGFQVEDLAWLESSSIERDKTNRRIKIMAKQLNQQTTNPKIFAGGDIVRGANLVVNAIADGMQGARDIQQFLLN